jgi:Ca2+-binding RTX toxin-like protein
MSTIVTVQGAHGTVSLTYDSPANALLAQYVANAIASGISGSTIIPADSAHSPSPPGLSSGKTGEFVQLGTPIGVLNIPKGYNYLVDAAPSATFNDANSNSGQEVLVGAGNLNFIATLGAGSVIGGGGVDQVVIAATNPNAWLIALGNGNDTIRALGSGNDTISLGAGSDSIFLGAGSSAVTTGGAATITATTGSETVTGLNTDVIYGAGSLLTFVGTGGATVYGGTGSDTVTGGNGPDYFRGGSAGNNVLRAGVGAATLFGGGNGDKLYANGSGAQILYAGSGNETLTGGSAVGAPDTIVAGVGAASVVASPVANNVFQFISGMGGGSELVMGLNSPSQVHIHLSGYGGGEQGNALATQINSGESSTLNLSDGTSVTFHNVSTITAGNFT